MQMTGPAWRARAAVLRGIAMLFIGLFMLNAGAGSSEAKLLKIAPGNVSADQPEIPKGAVSRTRATDGSFQAKYEKIRDLIATNTQLQDKIRTAAELYEIAPVHIVGALVGEHTYNVDALDRLQTYVVKAASYFGSSLTFRYDGEKVVDFVERPQFDICRQESGSYDIWSCREFVWETQFRGEEIDGIAWPDDRFGRVFFQPLFAGQTFGLGQLNPLAALRVNDMAVKISGFQPLNASRAPEIYKAIMDPDTSLHYMAAIIRTSIDAYRNIAMVDISDNPGITATLYNLGDVRRRAEELRQRRLSGTGAQVPLENYYGWLVNEKIDELAPLVEHSPE